MNRHHKRALTAAILIEALAFLLIIATWLVQPHAHVFDYGVVRGIVAVLLFIAPVAVGTWAFVYFASKDVG